MDLPSSMRWMIDITAQTGSRPECPPPKQCTRRAPVLSERERYLPPSRAMPSIPWKKSSVGNGNRQPAGVFVCSAAEVSPTRYGEMEIEESGGCTGGLYKEGLDPIPILVSILISRSLSLSFAPPPSLVISFRLGLGI